VDTTRLSRGGSFAPMKYVPPGQRDRRVVGPPTLAGDPPDRPGTTQDPLSVRVESDTRWHTMCGGCVRRGGHVRSVEALLACWLPFLAAQTRADHELIVLKDGYQIVGDVIAEKAGSLTVDLGFDVVKVPRDQVVERRKAGAPAPTPGPAREAAPADGFFQV